MIPKDDSQNCSATLFMRSSLEQYFTPSIGQNDSCDNQFEITCLKTLYAVAKEKSNIIAIAIGEHPPRILIVVASFISPQMNPPVVASFATIIRRQRGSSLSIISFRNSSLLNSPIPMRPTISSHKSRNNPFDIRKNRRNWRSVNLSSKAAQLRRQGIFLLRA